MKISLQNHVIREEDENHNEASIDVFVDEYGVQVNVSFDGGVTKRIDINNNEGKIQLQVINHKTCVLLNTQNLENENGA